MLVRHLTKILAIFLAFEAMSQGTPSISNGEVLGVTKAVISVEQVSTAKKNSIATLKAILGEDTNFEKISQTYAKDDFKSGTFEKLLNELDQKYRTKLDELKKDNIDDALQIKERSALNRYYSMSVSSQCYAVTTNEEYIKTNDLAGNEVISFPLEKLRSNTRYGSIESYSQGFSRIKKDQVYGFLNYCGEEVIPAQYEYAEPFNDAKALVKKFVWYFIDAEGNESEELLNIVDAKAIKYGISIAKFKNNKFALIDNNYDVSKKPSSQYYDQIESFSSDGSLLRVRNGKAFGVITIGGSGLIDVSFDKLTISDNEDFISAERAKKVGLFDAKGVLRIPVNFESVEAVFVNQALYKNILPIVVKDAAGFKIYELNNNTTSNTFASLSTFNVYYGLAKACALKGGKLKCGYVNYEGSEVIPIAHDEISAFSKYGLVVASDKFEACQDIPTGCTADIIYNKDGMVKVPRSSNTLPAAINYFVTDTVFSGPLVIVRTEQTLAKGKFEGVHLIDKVSHNFITQQPYLMIKKFADDMILAMSEPDKYGIIDFSGKTIVKPSYKEILNFSEGLFGVRYDNNKLGYVDRKGKVQVTFEYTDINPFKNGIAIVGKNNKFGVISKFNAKIAPCFFETAVTLPNGNIELSEKNGTKYLLSHEGDCITNCAKFDDIRKKANN